MGDLLSCGTLSNPTLFRPCALLRAGCGGPAPRVPPKHHRLACSSLFSTACSSSERFLPGLGAVLCGGDPPRAAGAGRRVWGWLFSPLNSIFSTRRSSRGSRRQLLLRETSGFAVVADALIPAPWKTLLRPAPQPPGRRGNNKTGGEKQDWRGTWKCQAARFKAIRGSGAGGAGTQRDRWRQLPGVGRCRWARSGGSRWRREPSPRPGLAGLSAAPGWWR